MNGSHPAWEVSLRQVLGATSWTDAFAAADRIVDVAIPGRAVLAPDVPDLIAAVGDLRDLPAQPHRVYIVALVSLIAIYGDTWRSHQAAGDATSTVLAGVSLEEACERAVRVLLSTRLVPLAEDPDPEVRSMTYWAVAVGSEPAPAWTGWLLAHWHSERDLAAAYGFAAWVTHVARSSRPWTEENRTLLDSIASATAEERALARQFVTIAFRGQDQREQVLRWASLENAPRSALRTWPSDEL